MPAKAAVKWLLSCASKRQSKPELMAAPNSHNWDNWSWQQQRDVQAQHIPHPQPHKLLLTPPSMGVPRGLKGE